MLAEEQPRSPPTHHRLIIGSSTAMPELADESVQLVVTSPPYFNAPFDYENLYPDYPSFLVMLRAMIGEVYRVLQAGRIFALNIDDMLVDGMKYPIVADATRMAMDAGFRYRDRIVWKKPEGYIRISRRSGVLLQHPYPMYFYPDNVLESILLFQKGKFDYKSADPERKARSQIDTQAYQQQKWFLSLWEMTNVLPNAPLEKNIAAFPEELPRRIITLFSYVGDTVLDPFAGSGTTMRVARELHRNSIGIEIKPELVSVIRQKVGIDAGQHSLLNRDDTFEVVQRACTALSLTRGPVE